MAKPDTWMPLVIRDYLADTTHLSTAEHGAYLLLLMAAWTRGGTLPDDDAQLARITRASAREWKALRASLAPFFHAADGEWRQKRLLKELAEATANAAKAGAKASTAAATRWGKQPPDDAPSIAQALPEDIHKQSPIPIPSNSLRSLEKPSRARPADAPIPAGFAISERVYDWARRKGFVDLDRYLEIFVGRNSASGKRYADWDQAFMNAIREDWYGLRKAQSPPKATTLAERRVAAMDVLTGKVRDERTIEVLAERVGGAPVLALAGGLRQSGDDDVGRRGPGGSAVGLG